MPLDMGNLPPCAVLSLGSFQLGQALCHGWILYVESAGAGAANHCHSLEGVGDSKGDAVADTLGGI